VSTRSRKPASQSTSSSSARAKSAPAKKAASTAPTKLARGSGTAAKKGTLVKVAPRKSAAAAPTRRARSTTADGAASRPVRAVRKAAGTSTATPRKAAGTSTAAPRKAAGTSTAAPRKAAAKQVAPKTREALPKRARAATPVAPVEQLRKAVRHALDELKARDVVEIDVRDKTSVCDWFVIVSGTSSRHVKSLADEVVKAAKGLKMPPLGVEGQREGEWVVVDLADLVVHIFQPRVREFYALEKLWGVSGAPVATVHALSPA
jgi:ribosome-associated protein